MGGVNSIMHDGWRRKRPAKCNGHTRIGHREKKNEKSLETIGGSADKDLGGALMGDVSSVNPGVTDLLQTLSNLNSSVLSSPAVTSALESAPTTDIVQLSMAATQLEGIDTMFGISNGSNTGTSSILASLEDPPAGSAQATLSTASPADRLADYQAALQATETQGLFGIGPGGLSGSIFNLVG
jgi:hypothetical protein